MKDLANILIILGITILIMGLLLKYTDIYRYFGKLPGDISFNKGNFSLFFPITTLIIINVLINLIIRLFRK